MSATRDALEAALAEHPDDVAAHAAYADLLTEEGDPRGEYVRLQLALEDRDQPADRLRAMEQRAFELRQEHEREWLGPLAAFVFPDRPVRSVDQMVSENVAVTWRRGWVHGLTVGRLTEAIQRAVAHAPLCRLLAEFMAHSNESVVGRREQGMPPSHTLLETLCTSASVRNLTSVTLGTEAAQHLTVFDDDSVVELVKRTPRLEHLRICADRFRPARVFMVALPALRSLHVASGRSPIPVSVLGQNKSLAGLERLHVDLTLPGSADARDLGSERLLMILNDYWLFTRSQRLPGLRDLTLRCRGFGDEGVDELIVSGMIGRLRRLDLSRCDVTDDGAQALANCPAVRGLESLHLDNNYLSPIGIDALAAVGVTVSDRQFFAGGWGDDDGAV